MAVVEGIEFAGSESISKVKVIRVDGEKMKEELMWLRQVLETAYGPCGRRVIVQPVVGGVLILTKCAQKILRMLQPRLPLVKVMQSHLQEHAHCYRESTLYAGILTTSLVIQGLELKGPNLKVAMEISNALSSVCEWLRSEECGVKYELNLLSSKPLLTLLYSFMATKLNHLSTLYLNHIASLLLQAFLKALPSSGVSQKSFLQVGEYVSILPLPLCHTPFSSLCDGVLLFEDVCCPSALQGQSHMPRNSQGHVTTALFSSSLAGDEEGGVWVVGAGSKMEGDGNVSVKDEVVKVLLCVGQVLVKRGVSLLACQKCVHPLLRDYLHQQKVVVMERVSSASMSTVHGLCGGSLICSTSCHALSHAELGTIRDVESVVFVGHRFVQLKGLSDSHSTLLLCADSERNMDELESLCYDALKVCEWCVREPMMVCGAGCVDTAIAHFLRTKARTAVTEEEDIRRSVLDMISTCFERQALALDKDGATLLTDSIYHHCWTLPPPSLWPSQGVEVRNLMKGKSCNCGGVSFSDLPLQFSWTFLSPTLSPLPLIDLYSDPSNKPRSVKQSDVCDLLIPRLAALECAAELTQTVLSIALTVSQQDTH